MMMITMMILMKMMRVKRLLTRSHLYCPLCIRALTPSSRPGSTLTKRCQFAAAVDDHQDNHNNPHNDVVSDEHLVRVA